MKPEKTYPHPYADEIEQLEVEIEVLKRLQDQFNLLYDPVGEMWDLSNKIDDLLEDKKEELENLFD